MKLDWVFRIGQPSILNNGESPADAYRGRLWRSPLYSGPSRSRPFAVIGEVQPSPDFWRRQLLRLPQFAGARDAVRPPAPVPDH